MAPLGEALTSLGLALEMTGDRGAAAASYREALTLYRAAGRPELEALVLSNLAALAIGGGDYGAALAWLAEEEAVTHRALAAGEAAWAEAELDYVRMNRSVALEQLGAYAEALAEIRPLAERALKSAPAPDESGDSAALTVNLAVLYRNLGDPRRALVLLARAAEAYERLGDRSALANVHLNRGLVYQLNLRAPEQARSELSTALELARVSGDRGEEIRTLCALGELQRSAGDLGAAREAFDRARAAAKDSGAASGSWAAEAGLGRVARDAGDPPAAIAHLRNAIEGIEQIGEGVGDSALRGGLLADQRAVYASAVDLLAEDALRQTGPPSERSALEALALTEQARGRELLDALAGGYSGAPLRAQELSALAPRLQPALVYFAGENHLWRWQVDDGRWRVDSVGSPGEVADLVTRIHRQLARSEAAAQEDLERLSDRLLPRRIPAGSELRVVPDGRLFYLPFEILPDPADPRAPLLERRDVSYLPSLSVLARLRTAAAKVHWQLVALADPQLASGTTVPGKNSLAGLLAQRFGLPPLPGAVREARFAAERLGARSSVETGAAASEAKLRVRVAEGARVLHVAAHTVVDESLAGGLALFLAPGAGSDPSDDGLVDATELARLPLAVDLAVLSGCRTALAQSVPGESASGGRVLASLSGALLGAGARGVVASLWDVGDEATAALMEQFYFELARGERPARALRRAKLRLASDARWSAAPAWAGFVLLGDPGPVSAPSTAWAGPAAAIGLIAAGAVLGWLGRRRAEEGASG